MSGTKTITLVSKPLRHWIDGNSAKLGSKQRQRHFVKAWPVRARWLAAWAKAGMKSWLTDMGK